MLVNAMTHALRSRRGTALLLAPVVCLAFLAIWVPRWAHAGDTPKLPVAPPGRGPVSRALPPSATPRHGLPAGQLPPVVPPGVPAAGKAHKLSADQWSRVPRPGTVRKADGPPPSTGGARDVLLRPGFELDDTSLVVYFN